MEVHTQCQTAVIGDRIGQSMDGPALNNRVYPTLQRLSVLVVQLELQPSILTIELLLIIAGCNLTFICMYSLVLLCFVTYRSLYFSMHFLCVLVLLVLQVKPQDNKRRKLPVLSSQNSSINNNKQK